MINFSYYEINSAFVAVSAEALTFNVSFINPANEIFSVIKVNKYKTKSLGEQFCF